MEAGTISGSILTAGSSGVSNGTLAFTLSQTAYKSDGTGVLATSPTNCYTSTDGSIVGVPNSLVAPSVSNSGVGGTIPAATYFVKIAYWNATGVGLATPSGTVTTTTGSTSSITVNMPALQPATASGIKIYVGTVSGSETLQATVTGFGSSAVLTSYSAGTALPSTNTSTCSIAFNDTLIPSYTTYRTSLVDANGNTVPGFPQNYYFAGAGPLNLALQFPAGNLKALFPSAIIASPSGQTTQSINGGLTVSGLITLASGVKIQVASGAPVGTCVTGSLYLRTDSAANALYVCQSAAWAAK